MGIMDAFRTAPKPPVQPNQPANTTSGNGGTPAVGTQQVQESGGSVQIATAQAKKDEGVTSPLDPYKDLWDTPNTESGNSGDPTNSGTQQAKTPATPQKPDFAGYAKKVKFSQVVPRDLAAKALGGDVDSFYQIIDAVSQASFAASLSNAHSMGEKSIGRFKESFVKELPDHFKSYSVANSGYRNPAYKNPAMRPLVDSIKAQLSTKFPDASIEEIDRHAEDYFNGMMMESNPEFKQFMDAKKSASQTGRQPNGQVDPSLIEDPRARQRAEQEAGTFDWDSYYGLTPQ